MKYYIPDITEFHVGFEFEVKDLHDNLKDTCWRKDSYDSDFPTYLEDWLKKEDIRVKYLDLEDIESEGWKLTSELNINGGVFDFERRSVYMGRSCQTRLHKAGNFIEIKVDFEIPDRTLFHGDIKNINELRRLQQQLGIKVEKQVA